MRRRATPVLCAFLPLGMVAATAHGARSHTVPPCRVAQFAITRGPELTATTGQNPIALRLTNRTGGACVLKGYPKLAFVDVRGVIPFVVRHGGDQMITARRPTPVMVRTGGYAFVALDKYRCDSGDIRLARSLRIGLPNARRTRMFRLPAYPRLGYCGAGDPGSTVAISPFESSLRAALRRH